MKIKTIKILIMGAMGLIFTSAQAQQISGTIYEQSGNGDKPLPGVNIYWSGTQTGTISDAEGNYTVERPPNVHMLVFSFVGYHMMKFIIITSCQVAKPLRKWR
jgi:hypothetical protein